MMNVLKSHWSKKLDDRVASLELIWLSVWCHDVLITRADRLMVCGHLMRTPRRLLSTWAKSPPGIYTGAEIIFECLEQNVIFLTVAPAADCRIADTYGVAFHFPR